MHPLLALATGQPQLLAEHAQAYGELVSAELARVASTWKRQALLHAGALIAVAVTAVLAGVALMLWAALPTPTMPAPWLLILVPLAPLLAAFGCLMAARGQAGPGAFNNVREHVQADLLMLRAAVA